MLFCNCIHCYKNYLCLIKNYLCYIIIKISCASLLWELPMLHYYKNYLCFIITKTYLHFVWMPSLRWCHLLPTTVENQMAQARHQNTSVYFIAVRPTFFFFSLANTFSSVNSIRWTSKAVAKFLVFLIVKSLFSLLIPWWIKVLIPKNKKCWHGSWSTSY